LHEPNGGVAAPAQLADNDVFVIEDLVDADGVETAGSITRDAFFFIVGLSRLLILRRCRRGGVRI